jgi:hypothetical protein
MSGPPSQPQYAAPAPAYKPPDNSELRGVVAKMKHFADEYGPSVRLVLSGLTFLIPVVIMVAGKRAGLNPEGVLNKWSDFVRTNPER